MKSVPESLGGDLGNGLVWRKVNKVVLVNSEILYIRNIFCS